LAPTNVICNGAADGTIDLAITGGAYPYTFEWKKGSAIISTVEDVINLSPGTYSVTVTDANGCIATGSAGITETNAIGAIYTVTDANCYGGNDGSINLTANGGQQPYTFLWTYPNSSTQTTEDISGLQAGLYSVNITDANGCSINEEIESYIDQPAPVTVVAAHADCPSPGSNTTMVTVDSLSGGDENIYEVSFDGGITFLNAGVYSALLPVDASYSIMAQDGNGCATSTPFSLTVDTLVEITSATFNPCIAPNQTAVSITVSPAGGAGAPYQISLNNGSTFNATGVYTFNVGVGTTNQLVAADNNGCLSTAFQVIIPSTINLSMELLLQNVSCFEGNNGSINLNPSGGTSPYVYSWAGPNGFTSTSQDINNLVAGSYLINVIDVNGCEDTLSIGIAQPEELSINSVMFPATCSGSDGMLDITVNGGTFPFSFNWTDGMTTEDHINYPTGIYSVTVTDAQGCLLQFTDTILSNSSIGLSAVINDVKCNGGNSGAIDITVLNSTPPLVYNWSNGSTTEDLSQLPAGIYSLSVTDSNSCSISMDFIIAESPLLDIDISSAVHQNGFNVSTHNGNDGSVDLLISGGTPPYSIVWNTGDTINNLSGLAAGNYMVVVTDGNGCTANAIINLTEPLQLVMPTGYTPNGDGRNDNFIIKGIEAYPDNEILIYNRWGNIVFDEMGYANDWNGTNNSGEELPDGTYYVVVAIRGTDITLTGYVDLRRNR
jgi:gliding motility-associated-like protein